MIAFLEPFLLLAAGLALVLAVPLALACFFAGLVSFFDWTFVLAFLALFDFVCSVVPGAVM